MSVSTPDFSDTSQRITASSVPYKEISAYTLTPPIKTVENGESTVSKKRITPYVNWTKHLPMLQRVVKTENKKTVEVCGNAPDTSGDSVHASKITADVSVQEVQFISESAADGGIIEAAENLQTFSSKSGNSDEMIKSGEITDTTNPNPDLETFTEDMIKHYVTNGTMTTYDKISSLCYSHLKRPKQECKSSKGIKSTFDQKKTNPCENLVKTSSLSDHVTQTIDNNKVIMTCENISGNPGIVTTTAQESIIPEFTSEPDSKSTHTFIADKVTSSLQEYSIPKTEHNLGTKSNTEYSVREKHITVPIPAKKQVVPKDAQELLTNSLGKEACNTLPDTTDAFDADNESSSLQGPSSNISYTLKNAWQKVQPVPLPRKKAKSMSNNTSSKIGEYLTKTYSEQEVSIQRNNETRERKEMSLGHQCEVQIPSLEPGIESSAATSEKPYTSINVEVSSSQIATQFNQSAFDNPLYMYLSNMVQTKEPNCKHSEIYSTLVEASLLEIPLKRRTLNSMATSKQQGMLTASGNLEFKSESYGNSLLLAYEEIRPKLPKKLRQSNCGCGNTNLALIETETLPKRPLKQRTRHSRAITNEGMWSSNPVLSTVAEETLPPKLPVKLQRVTLSHGLPDTHGIHYAQNTAIQGHVKIPDDEQQVVRSSDENKTSGYDETIHHNTIPATTMELKPTPKPRMRRSKIPTKTVNETGPPLPPKLNSVCMLSPGDHLYRTSQKEVQLPLHVLKKKTEEISPCSRGQTDDTSKYSNYFFTKQMEIIQDRQAASSTKKNVGSTSSCEIHGNQSNTKDDYVYDYAFYNRMSGYPEVAELCIPEISLGQGENEDLHQNSPIYEQIDNPLETRHDQQNESSKETDTIHQSLTSVKDDDYAYDYADCNRLSKLAKACENWSYRKRSHKPKKGQRCKHNNKPQNSNESHNSCSSGSGHHVTCSCGNSSKGSNQACSGYSDHCSCGNSSCGSHMFCSCCTGHCAPCSCGNSSCGSHNFCSGSTGQYVVCSCGNSSCGSHSSCSSRLGHHVACSCGNSSFGSHSSCSSRLEHHLACSCGNSSGGSRNSCSNRLEHHVECSCGNSSGGSESSCSSRLEHHVECSCGNSSGGSHSSCSSRLGHHVACSCGNSSCGSHSSCSSCLGHHVACSCGNSSDGSNQSCFGHHVTCSCGNHMRKWRHASSYRERIYAVCSFQNASIDPNQTCSNETFFYKDQTELDKIFSLVYFPGNARKPSLL
ncbi:uncharacterized protein LOC110457462 [Mizuhopecten yessoensis]|uniref:uncharacterized protein LOC110457462 n=1 Tax=Mizuhopecten yessoensis TaxID=6573 RepID=UPI000B45EE3B|nr:uncharacterized protein LOC110457462 [Mizuhopecten yessoensis]